MTLLRRILGFVVVGVAAVALVVLGTGASGDDGSKRYWVELDNAFGVVTGADVKIAGVRAGKVKELKLDRTDMRALIGVEITKTGFDDIRADVRCETRPQSLIGEYFIDCQPGTSPKRLKEGATIPVEQTETTIPVDLVNNIMRRPYRERYTILLSELGAGLAARGEDLNETIRRAVPALRQVDRLLAVLRDQRRVIRDLYDNADKVTLQVANKRTDVTRFVEEARDTARAAASEEDGIRAQWATLPTFLEELRPTLARLETTAEAQIPALENLGRAAPYLEDLFQTLGPFAEASRPAFRTLGDAAQIGRRAVKAAREPVAELRRGVDDLPEAATNLAMTLEHIDDPSFATEKDARAGRGPDGGFTGLEALIRYFFAQSQALNLFDANSFILKASIFLDRECANFTTDEEIKSGASPQRCRAWMGPNQPGITSGDFTAQQRANQRAARDGDRARKRSGRDATERRPAGGESGDGGGANGRGDAPAPSQRGGAGGGGLVPAPDLGDLLDDALPKPGVPKAPEAPKAPDLAPRDAQGALDYLLGP